jgi:hypothetical protein
VVVKLAHSDQPGHAVKISIIAREIGEAVGLHDGHDERVSRKQFALLANGRSGHDQRQSDRQDLDSEGGDLRDRSMVSSQLWYFGMVISQSVGNACRRPLEEVDGFESH